MTIVLLIIIGIIIFIIWLSNSSNEPSNEPSKKPDYSQTTKLTTYSSRNTTKDKSVRQTPSKLLSELKQFKVNYLYHMTHINNISSIYREGLVSNHRAHSSKILNRDISDPGVQKRRERLDPINNLSIHSYVPLYFNPKNPMLYVRKELQNNIAILVFDANSIFNHASTIYTDGNAASKQTKFYSSLSNLKDLDWGCIYATSYWNDFDDGKRKRCAEILVPSHIKFNEVIKILVSDSSAVQRVKSQLGNYKIEVSIDGKFYF